MVLDKIRTGLVASPWHNRQISPGSSSRQHADGAGEAEAGNRTWSFCPQSARQGSTFVHYRALGSYYSVLQIGSPYFHGLRLSSEPHRQRIMGLTVTSRRNRLAYCDATRYVVSTCIYTRCTSKRTGGVRLLPANFHAATGKAFTSGYGLL
jgi:hypothetical protein